MISEISSGLVENIIIYFSSKIDLHILNIVSTVKRFNVDLKEKVGK